MEISVVFPDRPSTKDSLQVTKKIGEGKFVIYQAYSPSHKTSYALKVFPKNAYGATHYQKEKFLSKLTHPNVIQYIPVKSQNSKFYTILTELAPYGDFFDVVTRGVVLSNEVLVRTYFHQLIKGIEYIHAQGVAHLDLKLENLMMGTDFTLKIIDFDQAQPISDKQITSKGSIGYRAPEIVNDTCYDPTAADVYSAGILLYAFQAKEYPFLELQDPENKDHRCYSTFVHNNETFWNAKAEVKGDLTLFSDDFVELVNGMLECDAKKRWTLKEIKNSKWYKGPILRAESLKMEMKRKWESLMREARSRKNSL